MARSKSGKTREASWYVGTNGTDGKTDGKPKRVMPTFVRCELNEQQKEHVKSQKYTWDDVLENIVSLVEEGYKVSFGEDAFNDCYACWLTAPAKDNPNSGHILQGRGPDVVSACAVCLYKHFTVFDGIWPKDDFIPKRDAWG